MLTNYRTYRTFIRDRNKALTFALQKNQLRLTEILDALKIEVMSIVLRNKGNDQAIRSQLQIPFARAIHKSVRLIQDMRRMTYGLTYAAEGEAISRVTGNPVKTNLSHHRMLNVLDKETPSGGTIDGRVRLAFSRIHRRIMDAVERIDVAGGDLTDALLMAFPRKKRYKRITRALRSPVKEANPFKSGIIEPSLWDDLVKEYTDEYLFRRGPKDIAATVLDKSGQTIEVYDWELEREVTNDFVYQVRLGQVDSALENGIEDFVWIAILDNKTDDCCLWRDGKTSTEIEQLLKTRHSNDECDAIVPPAHFNCRCDIAPVTGKLQSIAPLELGDFSTWLK
jgi:hypothetical protein